MSSWSNTRENFAQTWDLEITPRLEITLGAAPNGLLVTARGARGLIDNETYAGDLDTSSGSISLSFTLAASGLSGGKKQLSFTSPVDGSSPTTATGPSGVDSAWGSSVADFEGTWSFAGGGEISIQNGDQIQCSGVDGLADLLFQGEFDSANKKITISFQVSNDGYKGDDSQNPKEVLFQFPEVMHAGGSGTPTEGERFEEVESGGGS